MGINEPNNSNTDRGIMVGSKTPQVEIRHMGSTVEVSVVTALDCQFIFNEFIRILHEEQADVVNASYSVVKDTVFHTIHCEVSIIYYYDKTLLFKTL